MRSLLSPDFSRAFFRGSHTVTWVTQGLSRSYNQAAQVPSSKVTSRFPRSPRINCRMVAALVSRTDSITTLPAEFITATEIVSLCTSMPMYFVLSMRGCSFSLRDEANHVAHPKNYPQKGALLECVVTYLVRPPL